MLATTFDVAIIGGGIMGSAAAFNLLKMDNRLKVAVVERDPAYTRASTTLSLSNARIQFSLRENIEISQYSLAVLERFAAEMAVGDSAPQVALRREGNLFLVSAEERAAATTALDLQRSLGCRVDWLTPPEISTRFPLYTVAGLAGATFSPGDGHFDAYAFLMGYRSKARSLGATYLHDEVIAIETSHHGVTGVRLKSGQKLHAEYAINCAGAWAAEAVRGLGIDLPVRPVKRQVFAVDTKVKPAGPLPLTVLPSGLYFRSETGGLILVGKSLEEDPAGFDFSWDDKRFTEVLWPELAEFVPAFDTLKLVRGWAGLYAVNTLDGNAILGEWPEIKGLYLANGFSGHGLQQGPAVGRYLAELITGRPPSLDLSRLGPERILARRPISENGLV
ncbi:MAG: FAD-binding oxidoreductase [Desulfobacterales bacterium]